VFGEGSFIGKGIYDVDAFEQALGGRFPGKPHPQPRPARRLLRPRRPAERRAVVRGLSGALQRRRQPPLPLDSRRLATAGWLRAACPARKGKAQRQINPLSALAQWKLIDNLRRSLVPAALTRCCCSAGRAPAGRVVDRSGARHAAHSALAAALLRSFPQAGEVLLRQHLRRRRHSLSRHGKQLASSWPVCLTRRFSVWMPLCARLADAGDARNCSNGIRRARLIANCRGATSAWRRSFRTMWIGPLMAVGLALYLTHLPPTAWRGRARFCCCGSLRR
jgi:cyclic beta-1,2-glucan synthetase